MSYPLPATTWVGDLFHRTLLLPPTFPLPSWDSPLPLLAPGSQHLEGVVVGVLTAPPSSRPVSSPSALLLSAFKRASLLAHDPPELLKMLLKRASPPDAPAPDTLARAVLNKLREVLAQYAVLTITCPDTFEGEEGVGE